MRIIPLLAGGIVCLAMAPCACAQESIYTISLDGATESPPVTTAGTGTGTVTVDLDNFTMRLETSFSDLTGNVSASHIHCCTVDPGMLNAGVATPVPTFPGFPSGVTAGSYDQSFDLTQLSSYNPAFVSANGGTAGTAMSALLAGFDTGRAYLNIHTSFSGSGEIRGFLQLIPEPATASMAAVALLSVSSLAHRRRRIYG